MTPEAIRNACVLGMFMTISLAIACEIGLRNLRKMRGRQGVSFSDARVMHGMAIFWGAITFFLSFLLVQT